MTIGNSAQLKAQVKHYWEGETCGTRYGNGPDRRLYFERISASRYRLEPYITDFAGFPDARGKSVLEIGVGAGADFANWCTYASHSTGVDLTESAIALTAERMALSGFAPEKYSLRTADAEHLPFPDATFDIVYSWGVLHHSPQTERGFAEARRVLKPGGELRAMIYHLHCWTAVMLYLQHAVVRGKFHLSIRDVLSFSLESPGTKAYTLKETHDLLLRTGFHDIRLSTRLGPGDLLTLEPSQKYISTFYRVVWKLYPRWLVRAIGDRYGMSLLIKAHCPA